MEITSHFDILKFVQINDFLLNEDITLVADKFSKSANLEECMVSKLFKIFANFDIMKFAK